MNKQQTGSQKQRGQKTASDEQGALAQRHSLNLIKAPPAPAVMHSDEVGAPLAQDQAIREKLRLYPRATINEIVGMFELEGVKVSSAAVKRARRK